MSAVAISSITVGARHRRDMGDLRALANSIAEVGLLQPIGVSAAGQLVFGERRLRACRDILGWTEIPVRTVEI
jgi:ParB family chromosome partitioning protein